MDIVKYAVLDVLASRKVTKVIKDKIDQNKCSMNLDTSFYNPLLFKVDEKLQLKISSRIVANYIIQFIGLAHKLQI